MNDLPRSVEWSIAFYRLLIKAYPSSFRQAYGDEMVLVFQDVALEGWKRNGWLGLVGMWLRVLADLFKAVPREFSSIEYRKTLATSEPASTYKSFRISMGPISPDLHWSAWRIFAVVVGSLLTLLAGLASFPIAQLIVLYLLDYSMHPIKNSNHFQTLALISVVIGIVVDVFIVWIGATWISKFASLPSGLKNVPESEI